MVEMVWLTHLCGDLQLSFRPQDLLFCDNQVVVHIATNPIFHGRTCHIELNCCFVYDKIVGGLVKLLVICTMIFLQKRSSLYFFGLIIKNTHELCPYLKNTSIISKVLILC